MRKPKWSCETVKKSFHEISPEEMKRKLAEIWELLVNLKCQPVIVPSLLSSTIPDHSRHETLIFVQNKGRRQND